MNTTESSLLGAVQSLKDKIVKNKLTIKEVAELSRASPEIVAILLDDTNNILADLSRMFDTFKVKIKHRNMVFKTHTIIDNEIQIKAIRKISPKGSIRYDIFTNTYFDLKWNRGKSTEAEKTIALTEFKKVIEQHLTKNSFI